MFSFSEVQVTNGPLQLSLSLDLFLFLYGNARHQGRRVQLDHLKVLQVSLSEGWGRRLK